MGLNTELDGPMQMLRRVIIGVVVVLPVVAMAKRTSDYIVPPYGVRLVHGTLGLLLLALPIGVIVAFVARMTGTDWARRVARSILAVSCTVVIGAMVAALDSLNDEGWNPAFLGSPFVALALPLGLYFALPPTDARRRIVIVATAGSAILGIVVVAVLGGEILQWARYQGWPVMW